MKGKELLGFTLAATMFLSGCDVVAKTVEPTPIVASGEALPTATAGVATEATAAATEAPTPIPTKAEFNVDTAKLYSVPASIEDLDANPDKYIKVADPLTDINTFNANFGKIKAVLGDPTKIEPNLEILGVGTATNGIERVQFALDPSVSVINGKLGFFYFEHEGKKYPVLLIKTVMGQNDDMGLFAIILYDGGDTNITGNTQGTEVLKSISEGKGLKFMKIWSASSSSLPDEVNQMIKMGLDGSGTYKDVCIGPGSITTEE